MERLKPVLYPLVSTVVLYLAFHTATEKSVTKLALSLFTLDFLLQLLMGIALFAISRRELLFPLLQAVVMSFFYLIGIIKIKMISGIPFGPYDIAGAIALYKILDLKEQLLSLAIIAGVVSLFIFNLKVDKKRLPILLVIVVLTPYAFIFYVTEINRWLDDRYTPQIWNKGHNFYTEGGTIYFIHETARMLSERQLPPDALEVELSIKALGRRSDMPKVISEEGDAQKSRGTQRDVHLIVVESLIDPLVTLGLPVEKDPFYPPFRKRYAAGGSALSLSPVYTGGTANAEFEILCGLPIYDGKIAFEYELANESIPCLPKRMAERGYVSAASHPNSKSYWNRDHAYPRLGFLNYYHEDDFEADDLNGANLSDESLYRQNLARIRSAKGPHFNYLLTISNHYPYGLSEKRQKRVTGVGDELIDNYLNAIYYSTRELEEHLQQLLNNDSNALIVVVGDHIPYFGYEKKSYIANGRDRRREGEIAPEDLISLTATPLLVIDGQKGPLSAGIIAHYEIPGLIEAIIGEKRETENAIVQAEVGAHLRPIPGYPSLYWNNGTYHVCKDEASALCSNLHKWQQDVEILRKDLLFGRQIQLTMR